jgi:hypothetical protein
VLPDAEEELPEVEAEADAAAVELPDAPLVVVDALLPHPASRPAPMTALAAAAITLLNFILPPSKSLFTADTAHVPNVQCHLP